MKNDIVKLMLRPAEAFVDEKGKTFHRYMVFGVLLTDDPLDHVKDDKIAEGNASALRLILEAMPTRDTKIEVGGHRADQILTMFDKV